MMLPVTALARLQAVESSVLPCMIIPIAVPLLFANSEGEHLWSDLPARVLSLDRFFCCVLFLLLALACSVCLAGDKQTASIGPVSVKLGQPETVLGDRQHGLRYFPDERIAVVRTRPDCRLLLAAGVDSVLLEGKTMETLASSKVVLKPGKAGDFDNGYAGIGCVWRAPSGELLAFYHAEDHEGMKALPNGVPGFYCRVALAVSPDDEATFRKVGPLLSGQLAKEAQGASDQGVGEPCVLAEPSGKYLYAYYTSHERVKGRGVQICMARCPLADAKKSDAWRKWHAGDFTEPGLGGRDTPVVTSNRDNADALFPDVQFVPAWRRFVMVFCVNAWRERNEAERSGIYLAFSDDGIHWPQGAMKQIWKVPTVAAIGREVAWHPTLILDEGTKGAATSRLALLRLQRGLGPPGAAQAALPGAPVH